MFRDGRLTSVTTQIFALPDRLRTPLDVVRLVGSLAPEGAVLTGWPAALLYGVRDAGPTMIRSAGTPIQICLARDDNRTPNGFSTLRVALDADDVEIIDGLPVTCLARTAYDMVRFSSSVPQAVGVLDAFRCELNPELLDMNELEIRIARRIRGRGHPKLRAAIAMSSTRSRSIPESVLRARMLGTLDLATDDLMVNATLVGDRRRWEVDLVDLTSGLVVEYDSVHHASLQQRENDALKDVEVREVGLGIQRVNATTLGKPEGSFADYLRRGQRDARRLGGASRARELAEIGRLLEHPLHDYESAGQPGTLTNE